MTKISFLYAALLLAANTLSAQQKALPLIKADSLLVSIRDNDILRKDAWTISPETKPDVYTTAVPKKSKQVTFYTDQDSITVTVKPNSCVLFNILLKGKDTALTGVYAYDTLATLKKAGKYNLAEKQELPAFTYQSAEDSNLTALRKTYHLDSIAGQGSEVSRIMNLMHWIHGLVPHDGSHGNPEVRNAMNMIEVCRKDKRGLNCRGLAMALNECYLSLGIPSRYVTCLPKDSLGIDNDCHVINMVYVSGLKKWIWIDPTFDAYVMNEKGELLGIEEVRARIIDGRPLILNPDANWNRRSSQTKEGYLYSYMAKNLYMLECSVHSGFDTETTKPGKQITYIRLIPLDYFKKSLEKSVSTNKVTKTSYITFRTNNPAAFWRAP
ncbi:transglutaminase-like domain-containing protein [Chitinophaga vietnamensis]|uniref:transglutaminase-like domain-containing protein n=1 Tax=Chitinophaga vietnamensis TaxID=2593957 RepID=UPI001178A504|nr:transglutaminase-like domain-containing protein [Chitinophaga vietnamensis]